MRIPGALIVAAMAATAATAVAIVIRVGWTLAGGAATPGAMVPLLVALAALCVVGLTIRRQPSVAWLATIAALAICTIDLAALARVGRATLDAAAWGWLSIAICVMALLATGAAVAYATDHRRRLGRWVLPAGLTALAIQAVAAIWVIANPVAAAPAGVDDGAPLGTLSVVTRMFLASTLAFTALGAIGDARPAAHRAGRRLALQRPPPTSLGGRGGYAAAWFRAFFEELAPGRTRAHQAAVSERSRIARELHADVVPAIRQALAEAERNGSVERLAAALRNVLGEVDDLVASRHSIVLEVDGLVPAVEWLAERAEERSDVRVTIDVPGAAGDVPRRLPEPVAAAAYRVAELALENVIRHAPGASVRIEIRAEPELISLVIMDDGPGIAPGAERAAASDGRRGLMDMRAEAEICGASLMVSGRDDGPGTVVQFHWPGD